MTIKLLDVTFDISNVKIDDLDDMSETDALNTALFDLAQAFNDASNYAFLRGNTGMSRDYRRVLHDIQRIIKLDPRVFDRLTFK